MLSVLFMGVTILFSHSMGVIAGFGPTILAFPLMLLVRDLYFVRPMLTVFGIFVTGTVLVSSWKHLNIKKFLVIIGIAGLGLPVGMLAYSYLPQKTLLIGVGVFTLLISVRGVLEEFFSLKKLQLPNVVLYIILFFAGVVHGAFTTGGPLLAIFTTQKIPDKQEFRATQGAIWVVFNILLSIQLFLFAPESIVALKWKDYREYLTLLPFLIVALYIGYHFQKKISIHVFRKIIFVMLLISASNILISNVL